MNHPDGTYQDLLVTAVHDLKNRLAIIRSAAQLGLEITDDDQATPFFHDIVTQSDRLVKIINSLLKGSQSRLLTNTSPVNVIEEILLDLHPVLKSRGINIETYWHSRAVVPLEPSLFRTAVENIIINAIQAMNGGGTLGLQTSEDAGRLLISISDTGMGIAPSLGESVFEPHVTSRPDGTGLGLYTARRTITQVHGGRIWFESLCPRGTTFYIELPLHAKSELHETVPPGEGLL